MLPHFGHSGLWIQPVFGFRSPFAQAMQKHVRHVWHSSVSAPLRSQLPQAIMIFSSSCLRCSLFEAFLRQLTGADKAEERMDEGDVQPCAVCGMADNPWGEREALPVEDPSILLIMKKTLDAPGHPIFEDEVIADVGAIHVVAGATGTRFWGERTLLVEHCEHLVPRTPLWVVGWKLMNTMSLPRDIRTIDSAEASDVVKHIERQQQSIAADHEGLPSVCFQVSPPTGVNQNSEMMSSPGLYIVITLTVSWVIPLRSF